MNTLQRSPRKEHCFPTWFRRRYKINVKKNVKTRVGSKSQVINYCPTIRTVRVVGSLNKWQYTVGKDVKNQEFSSIADRNSK